jgi:glycosyltransferase involved in cell wall biosynthesis
MRITVDLSPLLIRSAGVKGYLYHWFRALSKQADVQGFPNMGALGPLDHEHGMASAWKLASVHLARVTFGWSLPRTDLFHATNIMVGGPPGALLTTTLHDATSWRTPKLHTSANREIDEIYARRILRRADGIIAVSEHTRKDAIELLGVKPEKIRTIHSGVAEEFFSATSADAARVKATYKLDRPYVLFVGTIEPRKNLDRLLEACGGDIELVVAGPKGWAKQKTLRNLESCRQLGYVPEADLPGLTKGAAVLAYPSLYEGFGFPVAQAMACGVPVLTSSVSSLPEVAGEGALLVDPESVQEIRAGLLRLMESAELRAELGAKGRQRAEHYRWARCARESLEFFKEVAGARGSV